MDIFMQHGTLTALIIALWVLPWKGYSLWIAAKNSHKGWFIALLILNTFAILDIFYVFYIAKRQLKDIKHDIGVNFTKKKTASQPHEIQQ